MVYLNFDAAAGVVRKTEQIWSEQLFFMTGRCTSLAELRGWRRVLGRGLAALAGKPRRLGVTAVVKAVLHHSAAVLVVTFFLWATKTAAYAAAEEDGAGRLHGGEG